MTTPHYLLCVLLFGALSSSGQSPNKPMCDESFYIAEGETMNAYINNPEEMDSLVTESARFSSEVNVKVEQMNAMEQEIKYNKKVFVNALGLFTGTSIPIINTMNQTSPFGVNVGLSISPKQLFLSGIETKRLRHKKKSLYHEKEIRVKRLRDRLYSLLFERLILLEQMVLNHEFLQEADQYYIASKEQYKRGDINYKQLRIEEANYARVKLAYHKSEYKYQEKTIEFNNIVGRKVL